ncbi:hypothetical protein DFH06DRAFT_985719 [Mycena polygramma]|nr:hypothetical protein DFH06DRAFT_985719 [Mycena polygramma]
MKLVFGFSLDFFPPSGSRNRSNSNSIGLLAIYCLNFPNPVRYIPEHMHISIITGKSEPLLERINPYLRPTVDVGVIGWERGIHLSKTALSEEGRIVDVAFPLSVDDLPAARKASATMSHGGHIFCTVCNLRGRANVYRTDFENWTMRDKDQMRADAEAWRDAETLSHRNAIFQQTGSRYSELWRFIYWDPPKMVPTEAMHAVFEGVGKYFSREVMMINLEDAKKAEDFVPAFDYDFALFDPSETVPQKCQPVNDAAEKDIFAIHHLLVSPFHEDEPESDPTLTAKLAKKRKTALIFVCWSLDLAKNPVPPDPKTGASIEWEEYLPLRNPDPQTRPKTITMPDFRFIQQVIAETDTPAWVHHVPRNYGEPAAGSMKADQMRLLLTIYLPIALVILWSEQTGPNAPHFRTLLNHAMAFFQAVTIMCRYAMTAERATAFRNYMKQWVDDLYSCYPHTKHHKKRTNVHVTLHIYDFLLLWGPVISWWAFPVERLIGVLQKFTSNKRVGGEHEATILTTWMRGANLRRWLKSPNCPKVLQEFNRLFNLYHDIKLADLDARPTETEPTKTGLKTGEQAYYDFADMHFSRAKTHVGNSLVSYLDVAGKTWFGSIEKIKVTPEGSVSFAIRTQDQLPAGKNDPFKDFPHFPAYTYSSKMAETLVDVEPSRVLGHYARFNFSDDRTVVLDLRRVCPYNLVLTHI